MTFKPKTHRFVVAAMAAFLMGFSSESAWGYDLASAIKINIGNFCFIDEPPTRFSNFEKVIRATLPFQIQQARKDIEIRWLEQEIKLFTENACRDLPFQLPTGVESDYSLEGRISVVDKGDAQALKLSLFMGAKQRLQRIRPVEIITEEQILGFPSSENWSAMVDAVLRYIDLHRPKSEVIKPSRFLIGCFFSSATKTDTILNRFEIKNLHQTVERDIDRITSSRFIIQSVSNATCEDIYSFQKYLNKNAEQTQSAIVLSFNVTSMEDTVGVGTHNLITIEPKLLGGMLRPEGIILFPIRTNQLQMTRHTALKVAQIIDGFIDDRSKLIKNFVAISGLIGASPPPFALENAKKLFDQKHLKLSMYVVENTLQYIQEMQETLPNRTSESAGCISFPREGGLEIRKGDLFNTRLEACLLKARIDIERKQRESALEVLNFIIEVLLDETIISKLRPNYDGGGGQSGILISPDKLQKKQADYLIAQALLLRGDLEISTSPSTALSAYRLAAQTETVQEWLDDPKSNSLIHDQTIQESILRSQVRLGNSHITDGRYDEAEMIFKRLLKSKSKPVEAGMGLYNSYMYQNRIKEAHELVNHLYNDFSHTAKDLTALDELFLTYGERHMDRYNAAHKFEFPILIAEEMVAHTGHRRAYSARALEKYRKAIREKQHLATFEGNRNLLEEALVDTRQSLEGKFISNQSKGVLSYFQKLEEVEMLILLGRSEEAIGVVEQLISGPYQRTIPESSKIALIYRAIAYAKVSDEMNFTATMETLSKESSPRSEIASLWEWSTIQEFLDSDVSIDLSKKSKLKAYITMLE